MRFFVLPQGFDGVIMDGHLDRKIYHLTLREGYCARFDDRTQSGLLWPSQKKIQWHRSQFSNAL